MPRRHEKGSFGCLFRFGACVASTQSRHPACARPVPTSPSRSTRKRSARPGRFARSSSSGSCCCARPGSRSGSPATIRGRPRTRRRSASPPRWPTAATSSCPRSPASRTCRGRRSPTWAARCRSRRSRRRCKSHNAARLVAGVALALILLATALASRELNGRAFRWLPVLILVGSVGFWDRAHVLSPELFLTRRRRDRALRFRAGAAPADRGRRRRSASASRSRSWAADCWGRCGSSSPRCCCRSCGAEWRNRAYAVTLAIARRASRSRCRCRGRSRCTRATPRCSRCGGRASRSATTSRSWAATAPRPLYYLRNLALVRVAVAAAAPVAAVAARARLQRRPARAGHRRARRARARDPRAAFS